MGWQRPLLVHPFHARRELMPPWAGIHLQHKEPPVGPLETQAGFPRIHILVNDGPAAFQ